MRDPPAVADDTNGPFRRRNPIGQEIARLARNPVVALLKEQERSREQLLAALGGPTLRDQIGSATDQHRRNQEDQLAQVRKLFERPSVFDQINAIVGGFEVQRLEAYWAVQRAFETPRLGQVQESMSAFNRAMGIGALAERLVADSMAELHRVVSGPGETVRGLEERHAIPVLGTTMQQPFGASRSVADLFSGLGSATQGLRELMEQAALDGAAGDRAADFVDRQLDAVELLLRADVGQPQWLGAEAAATPASQRLSVEARLALAALLIALLSFLQDCAANLAELHSRQQDESASAETAVHLKRMLALMERTAGQATRAAKIQPRILAVGTRSLTVRSAPGTGYRVGTAHPNQLVEQTGHQGRWLRVRFRDHNEERDIEGWVLKHRLIPTNKSN